MPVMLPDELVDSISKQWPCRQLQIRQVASLLHPSLPSSPSIVVHGPEASGKSGIVTTVLDAYARTNAKPNGTTPDKKHKRRKVEKDADDSLDDSLRYSVVKVAECITTRHLLTKIVSSTIGTVRSGKSLVSSAGTADREWLDLVNNSKCEHVSSLSGILGNILDRAACQKFVLVLDGVDQIREGGQMLLAALARVGELVPSLCVLFVVQLTPRPLLLQITGVPHIHFPSYTRDEALSIMMASGPPDVHGLPRETSEKLFEHFLSTLYDSLVGPAAGTIHTFRSTCHSLWPRFVLPIVNGETPPGVGQKGQWDFPKLLVKNRGLFQQQGELALVRHIISEDSMSVPSFTSTTTNNAPTTQCKAAKSPLPSLPYISTLILTAAFLAAHTPPRMDTAFFSKFTSSRGKRVRRRKRAAAQAESFDDPSATPRKEGRKKPGPKPKATTEPTMTHSRGGGPASGFLNPRPFPVERLLAIYHAINPNPPLTKTLPFADAIHPELATLQRLRLLVPASSAAAATGGTMEAGEKWCLNIAVGTGASLGGEWIIEMAKDIGVDIEEYVAGLVG